MYGRARAVPRDALSDAARDALATFPRQALHAATLGFVHPLSGEAMRFEADPPADMAALLAALRAG